MDLVNAGFKGNILTTDVDLLKLAELASNVRDGVILEIGSRHGASACVMAANANAPVYCVDTWDLQYLNRVRLIKNADGNKCVMFKNMFAKFQANVQALGLGDKIIPVNAPSSEIAKVWRNPIGLLFIDGNHSYNEVRQDYDGFAHHVILGGYLAFHDYSDKWPGVKSLVDEVRVTHQWENWQEMGITPLVDRVVSGALIFARRNESNWYTSV